MYYVDVCESECLDVARGLWLTGAEYISLYVRGDVDREWPGWKYTPKAYRSAQLGGYSNT